MNASPLDAAAELLTADSTITIIHWGRAPWPAEVANALKALPDGMHGLTSLRELTIRCCPAMKEFPHGLLEKLPALKSLSIMDCPELEGGNYFHLETYVTNRRYPQFNYS